MRFWLLLLVAVVVTGCGRSGPEPTPTPTKTRVAVPVEAAVVATGTPAAVETRGGAVAEVPTDAASAPPLSNDSLSNDDVEAWRVLLGVLAMQAAMVQEGPEAANAAEEVGQSMALAVFLRVTDEGLAVLDGADGVGPLVGEYVGVARDQQDGLRSWAGDGGPVPAAEATFEAYVLALVESGVASRDEVAAVLAQMAGR